MKKLLLLWILLALSSLHEARGQDRVVSGKVTSKSDGMGIPGVTISVPGTTIGTISDINGSYKLTLDETVKKLSFSGVGLKKQELEIGASNLLDVVMEEDILKLNEMVVTALGIPREKKSLGYSVQ